MHMRGSRFYSKLAAIALSYFFNAPRALISRPPNCENFQTTAGRPKVHSQPFHLWTSPCFDFFGGPLEDPLDLPLSLGYQPHWAQGKLFSSKSHGKQTPSVVHLDRCSSIFCLKKKRKQLKAVQNKSISRYFFQLLKWWKSSQIPIRKLCRFFFIMWSLSLFKSLGVNSH